MERLRSPSLARFPLLLLSSCLVATGLTENRYIQVTGYDGVSRDIDASATPALYTGNFGDCMDGQSLFNVTKFDAAYYADSLAIFLRFDGMTSLRKEDIMLYISFETYGENRFSLTYDPCMANVSSLCPLNISVPITASVAIPIQPIDASGISSIPLGIPDLEGVARLQIFANSTKSEIGCFQAALTNGHSFSQPQAVGSFLGAMTCVAVFGSFATAIYGLRVPHIRVHYSHSFSVLVIFETFQSMFFSGALSVNWPAVLPAWWSNFAWTAGMISNDQLVRSVSSFTGTDVNINQVGGAGSVPINNGGGLSQQIYGRSIFSPSILQRSTSSINFVSRRDEQNTSDVNRYDWGGHPSMPGMPMPGTWPGFGGTLSAINIPPTEALTISLIWLLVLLAGVIIFVIVTKLILDILIRFKWLKTDGFDYFRSHVWGYTAAAVLRSLFIAFFAITTLSMYQFSVRGPAGPTTVAVVAWLILSVGLGGIAAYACYFRLREGRYETEPDTLRFERGLVLGKVPFIATTRQSNIGEEEPHERPYLFGTVPFVKIKYVDNDPDRAAVHLDERFIKRFGWLSARYRRSRWWFFIVYLGYQFVRACFIGGGARAPLAQVYGLFIFELVALVVIIKLNPYESNRNTSVAVWMLSISKIVTTGLSIAFLPAFALNRIAATTLGIIIIVVQAFVATAVSILIILGIFSTWMSLSRNREEFPKALEPIRVGFYEHLKACSGEIPPQPREPSQPTGNQHSVEEPSAEKRESTLQVRDVQRGPKMHDETLYRFPELGPPNALMSGAGSGTGRRSRANSANSRFSVSSLPRSTRMHRASWSSKDIALWDNEMNRGDQQRPGHSRNMRTYNTDSHGTCTPSRRPMTPQEEILEEPILQTPDDLIEEESKESSPAVDDVVTEETAETEQDVGDGTETAQREVLETTTGPVEATSARDTDVQMKSLT